MASILLIEDLELNRELIVQLLEGEHTIIQAKDGEEGWDLANQNHPDLILLDLSLPKIDGWQLASMFRAHDALSAVPIIALTAHAMQGDREKALDAGCNDYISKPIDDTLLREKIDFYLASRQRQIVAQGSATVVVVEDSVENRQMLKEQLLSFGYSPILCESAEQALGFIERRTPDLFILDVTLPEMDGFELCRQIRQRASTRQVPVMLLSARAQFDDKKIGHMAGADDYITKPYDLDELRVRIEALLRLKQRMNDLRQEAEQLPPSTPTIDGPNKQAAYQRLDEECRRARRYNRPLSCILFKVVNSESLKQSGSDQYDRLFQEALHAVRDQIREVDFLYRLDDDEFLVVLPETGKPQVKIVVDRLGKMLLSTTLFSAGKARPGIGYAVYEQGRIFNWSTLLRAADEMIQRGRVVG